MLRDEVAAQAREPGIHARELAGAAGIAIQEYSAVAAAPELLRIGGAVHQDMDVGVRMRADRPGVRKRGSGAAVLTSARQTEPGNGCVSRVAAAQVQAIDIGRIDGQREIVRTLTAALRRRKHVGWTGDDLPLPRRRIEAVDAVECPVAVPATSA